MCKTFVPYAQVTWYGACTVAPKSKCMVNGGLWRTS